VVYAFGGLLGSRAGTAAGLEGRGSLSAWLAPNVCLDSVRYRRCFDQAAVRSAPIAENGSIRTKLMRNPAEANFPHFNFKFSADVLPLFETSSYWTC